MLTGQRVAFLISLQICVGLSGFFLLLSLKECTTKRYQRRKPILARNRPRSLRTWCRRQAGRDGRLGTFRMEGVVAAIQDLGPNADKSVIHPLVLHTSQTILRILRKYIGTNHRNEGNDIIEVAHGQLIQAIFTPNSADGKGLRQAFVPRIRFRAADAINKEMRKRERSVENIHEVSDAIVHDRTRSVLRVGRANGCGASPEQYCR